MNARTVTASTDQISRRNPRRRERRPEVQAVRRALRALIPKPGDR